MESKKSWQQIREDHLVREEKFKKNPRPRLKWAYTGRAGEHLVCVDFLSRGVTASLNNAPSGAVDVYVELGSRTLLVQVKTSERMDLHALAKGKYTRRPNFLGYRFDLTPSYGGKSYEHIDLFACVALDIRQVWYVSAKEAPKVWNGRAKLFLELADGSLDRFLFSELLN